jgi:RNA polymerase sigma-70 factor, ECF subfamily
MKLDHDAIARLYRTHALRLLRFVASRTLQADVAIEIVAETFAKAVANRDQFRGEGDEEAVAWLFGIARHELSAYFRRGAVDRRAMRVLGLDLPGLSDGDYERVEELADLGARRTELARAVAELPPEQRDALRLRVVEERPYREVAQVLGISEETARARVSRALRALSNLVSNLERSPRHA